MIWDVRECLPAPHYLLWTVSSISVDAEDPGVDTQGTSGKGSGVIWDVRAVETRRTAQPALPPSNRCLVTPLLFGYAFRLQDGHPTIGINPISACHSTPRNTDMRLMPDRSSRAVPRQHDATGYQVRRQGSHTFRSSPAPRVTKKTLQAREYSGRYRRITCDLATPRLRGQTRFESGGT